MEMEDVVMTKIRQIGTFTLTAEHTFDVPQEFAGAYQNICVRPGTFAIEERVGCSGRRYVGITMPGICVAEGWNSSCQSRKERPMTVEDYRWSTPYTAAERGMVEFWLGMLVKCCAGTYVLDGEAAGMGANS
jgi:hypothetical protein